MMPLIGAALAARFAWLIGLSAGSTATLMTLGHPPRLTEELERTGVTGYSVTPLAGGRGRSGRWEADDEVGERRDVRPVVHRRPADGSRLRQ